MRPNPLIPMRVAIGLCPPREDHSVGEPRRQPNACRLVTQNRVTRLLRGGFGLDVRRDEADELARQGHDLTRVVAGLAHLAIDALRENLDRLFALAASLRL